MKRGLLTPDFIRESHDCAIALRRRLCARASLVTNLPKPARDARVLTAKQTPEKAA